jgi:hypothetical protein
MGWPLTDIGDDIRYRKCLPPSLHNVSRKEQCTRSGNGMMLTQVYTWSLYVYTNIIRRQEAQRLVPSLAFKRPRPPLQEDDLDSEGR